MDWTYYWKRAMGTLTPEEEQAHRAKQAAEEQAGLRSQAQPALPPAPAPERVQPGTALRSRQDQYEEALRELERQNKGRGY